MFTAIKRTCFLSTSSHFHHFCSICHEVYVFSCLNPVDVDAMDPLKCFGFPSLDHSSHQSFSNLYIPELGPCSHCTMWILIIQSRNTAPLFSFHAALLACSLLETLPPLSCPGGNLLNVSVSSHRPLLRLFRVTVHCCVFWLESWLLQKSPSSLLLGNHWKHYYSTANLGIFSSVRCCLCVTQQFKKSVSLPAH